MSIFALFLVFAVLLGASSQLLLKSAFITAETSTKDQTGNVVAMFCRAAEELLLPFLGHVNLPLLLTGLIFYISATLVWILALQRFDLGKAYACLGLSYVLVYIGSVLWPRLSESITIEKTIGIVLVFLGVSLISSESPPRFGNWMPWGKKSGA